MSVIQQQVDTPAGLDNAVTSYLNQGYMLANRSDTRATLQKNKPPLNTAVIIIGLFIPVLGWAILIGYLILHNFKAASQVVEIQLAERALS